jgi:tetratricopeptide (TPR) repeat protein
LTGLFAPKQYAALPLSAAPQPRPPSARRPGPSGQIWFFRAFTAVVIPALLLLLLEGGLRVTGFGRPTGFFIPDDKPGYLRTNPDYVSLFLPGSFDLRLLNYRIAEKKPANTVRIVVLGESAAQGIPVPAFAFVPQLRAQLRARYPDKNIEVINTGVVAINSHVVYQITRDVVRYAPDLFVVYLGNNEVVGPYGPGCSYLSDMQPLWAIRLGVWVRSTRTGQLVAGVMAKFARLKKPAQEWGGMAMFMDHAVRGDDPRLETVYGNFEANLREIVRVATSGGAKTLLCTVVSNLKDSPPFLSLHRPGLTAAELLAWQVEFDAGKLAWMLNETDTARRHLAEAWRLDPQYADTAFMLGSWELQAGNQTAARKYYLEAQHWDALRFRPAPRLNQITREMAHAHPGVVLVDAAQGLGSDPSSPGDIPGRELMFEHVHPDWEGNHRIARLMAGGVEEALFKGEPGTHPWLDSAGCAAALGYTPVERFSVLQRAALITRHAPFPNQLTYAEDQARTAGEIAAAGAVRRDPVALRHAYGVVRTAAAGDPDNPDLARLEVELADDLGELPTALEKVRRAQTLQPANFALATDEAIKLARLGRFEEAEKLLFATAAACTPRDLDKMTPAIADFYTRTKRIADGRHWFDQALIRHPGSQHMQFYRGRLAQAAGDHTAAESDYRTVLSAKPENEPALESLVALLQGQGRTKEAEELCVQHVARQPDNQANHLRAAQVFEARAQRAEAAQALLAAARSGPVQLPVHLRLANLFYGQKQRREALDQLATAWRLARDENDRETADSIRTLIARIQAGH